MHIHTHQPTLLAAVVCSLLALFACSESPPPSSGGNAAQPGAENAAPVNPTPSLNTDKIKLKTDQLKTGKIKPKKLTNLKKKTPQLRDFKKLNNALNKTKTPAAAQTAKPSTLRDTPTPATNYPYTVGQSVDYAIYRGFHDAMTELASKISPTATSAQPKTKTKTPPTAKANEPKRPRGTVLTVWHTSNVHGEREDCGCPKRPLGGVARKATIIREAKTDKDTTHRPDGQLIVDAGNLLYKNTRVSTLSKPAQEVATLEAEALIKSFNTVGCDAFLPGEYDIAMGIDTLQKLHKASSFPWVSANLTAAGSNKPLFKPFVTTQRAGLKIAIVGVTGPFPDTKGDFFSSKGAGILDPLAALKQAAPAIKKTKPDLVVLLSNLGLQKTQQLTQSLRDSNTLPIHFVVASNTRRSTYQPVWDTSTPIVESGSRGKHLGRFDMHILDKSAVSFQPAQDPRLKPITDYSSAYRSLHTARKTIATSEHRNLNADRLARLKRNKRYTITRLRRIEADLPKSIDPKPLNSNPKASWFRSDLVAVDKAIEQDPKVRSILDTYIKRAEAVAEKHPELKSGKASHKGHKHAPPKSFQKDKDPLKAPRPRIDIKAPLKNIKGSIKK